MPARRARAAMAEHDAGSTYDPGLRSGVRLRYDVGEDGRLLRPQVAYRTDDDRISLVLDLVDFDDARPIEEPDRSEVYDG